MNLKESKPSFHVMQNQQQNQPLPKKEDSRAVASLVLGICSLVFPILGLIMAVIGLILGKAVLKESRENGMAKAGMIISIISLCFYAIPLAIGIIILLLMGIPLIGALISSMVS